MKDQLKPSFLRRLIYVIGLAAFFFTTYNFANYYASKQSDVPSWFYDWEAKVPLIPWTIIPYWSIDLFYGLSFLLPKTVQSLNRHALRLFTVQVISIFFFIIYPLKFNWDRPHLDGFFGNMFDLLMGFDKPFNQAPSLHISLLVVLWVIYDKYSKGIFKWIVGIWSLLIGLSVLTTWQHHFIDIPTGAFVGLLCVWLWPLEGKTPLQDWKITKNAKRIKLSSIYFAGAIALMVAGLLWGWKGWVVLWGALSVGFVSLAYLGFGPAIFQKKENTVNLPMQLMILPYVVCAYINSRVWTKKAVHPVHIMNGVYIGRIPFIFNGVIGKVKFDTAIDLCAELPCITGKASHNIFPSLDLSSPAPDVLNNAADAIQAAVGNNKSILVCCALGLSRSAAVVAAWLIKSGRVNSVEEAIHNIKKMQPNVVFSRETMELLKTLKINHATTMDC